MKTIYLLTEKGWTPFDFDVEVTKEELSKRNIRIGYGASIGDRASIEDRASIGDEARIGYRASIGDEATIGNRASIGDEATIGNRATIGDGATIGNGARIIKSIFITGTKHTVNWYGTGVIHIGCHCKKIDWWEKNYKMIGEKEGYSEVHINEYYGYIKICESLQKSNK